MSEEKKLVPKLRFPEFREAEFWKDTAIADILKVRNERCVPTGEVPLFSLTIESGVTEKTDRYNRDFLVNDVGNKKYKLVEPNDIVYNPSNLRWGAINYSQLSHSVVVSPIYEVLRLGSGSHHVLKFIACAVMRDQQIRRFIAKAQGTLVERIAVKIEDFLSTKLPVPSVRGEQQKIADCLSSLDELIAAQARKVDALKTHKKGLMQQLFPREGETQPRLRFPEFRDGGEWAQKTLGEVVEVASGQVDPTQPPYCDVPQIGSENIESDSGNLVNVKSARDKGVISGNYAFDEHDVLYSKIRPALNKAAAPAFEGICSADIYPIRPANDGLLRSYLLYLLLSPRFLGYAVSKSERGKIPKINRDDLLSFEAVIPSPHEQQRIADCLTSLDALITTATQELETLKTHKKGLMQQLFPSAEAVEA